MTKKVMVEANYYPFFSQDFSPLPALLPTQIKSVTVWINVLRKMTYLDQKPVPIHSFSLPVQVGCSC